MAKLSEILNLNKTKASINKIDLFLESSEKNGYEYIMALCFKAEIIHELGNTNEALKLIYPYTADVAKMENRAVIALYNAIIKICSDVERYDQVTKYIELKKGYLPISAQSAYIKDCAVSYGFGLLYPFIIYLFPSVFRIISLKCCKGSLSYIYFMSKIIPIF